MRGIKFRAWHKDTKEMFQVDVLALTRGPWSPCGRKGVSIPVQPHIEVMQYTGLVDINGVDIYEGDIVQCKMSADNAYLPHKGEIVYIERLGAFATKNISGETLLYNHCLNTFEVVGNKHENQELIKELKE